MVEIARKDDLANRALILLGKRHIELQDRNINVALNPDQVLVKVHAVGICGSDISAWKKGSIGNMPGVNFGLGHEGAGVVVEVGTAVKNVKPHDRIVIEPGSFCRRCVYCQRGQQSLCTSCTYAGTPPFTGFLADYYVAHFEQCLPIGPNVSWQEAACLQPLSIAIHNTRMAKLRPHQKIIILGSGSIGFLIGAIAKAYSVRDIACVDILPHKLATASKWCATRTALLTPRDPGENDESYATRAADDLLKTFNMPDGADIVFEASGADISPSIAINACGRGGTVLQVGVGNLNLTIPYCRIVRKQLRIQGSVSFAFQDALDLVERGEINFKPLISHTMKFENCLDAFQLLKESIEEGKQIGKIVILNERHVDPNDFAIAEA